MAGSFNGYQSHYRHSQEGIHYANLLYYALSQGDGNRQHVAEHFYKGLNRRVTPGTDEWKTMLSGVLKKYVGTDKPVDSPGFEDCEKAVRWFWQRQMEMESLELCNTNLPFSLFCQHTQDGIGDFELGSKMLNVVTGWDWSQEKLWDACEKLWILERAIACREGRRAGDDEFNETWLKENPMAASADGTCFDKAKIREGLNKLYALIGWNTDGVPTRARLEALDLKDVADDLEKRGAPIS
jgi:aldehyde:ferredoxin oxidoreductase